MLSHAVEPELNRISQGVGKYMASSKGLQILAKGLPNTCEILAKGGAKAWTILPFALQSKKVSMKLLRRETISDGGSLRSSARTGWSLSASSFSVKRAAL